MYCIIFILTLLDVTLTAIGLRSGYVIEANPLMAFFISRSLTGTMISVVIFSALSLLFVYHFGRHKAWVHYGLWIVLASKIVVLMFHFIWIGQVMTCTRL